MSAWVKKQYEIPVEATQSQLPHTPPNREVAAGEKPEREKGQFGLRKPLIDFALPLIAFIPYNWLLYQYLPGRGATLDAEAISHLRVHYGIFWVVTFVPFSAVCFVSSAVMLLRRMRHSLLARAALVPVGLLTLGVLVVMALLISDFLK